MPPLTRAAVARYLSELLGGPVEVDGLAPIGEPGGDSEDVKGYGYGEPILVRYRRDGSPGRAVLSTIRPSSFGHQFPSDRAAEQLWAYRAYNRMPRHARALDVGAFEPDGRLLSLGRAEEVFLLVEFVEGREYYHDLNRLRDGGDLRPLDLERADALCDFLVDLHRERRPDDAHLYARHVRETIGASECILGLIDEFPIERVPFLDAERMQALERRCLEWRWRLRPRSHRLCSRHGDYHPWNVLFREGADFTVLDRSRGEWGEAADDVVCMSINYLFFALQRHGRVEGPLGELFRRFWHRYLERTGDEEILEVAAPYFAFRGLVLASPVWYPHLDESVRRAVFSLMEGVLEAERFEPDRVDDYL